MGNHYVKTPTAVSFSSVVEKDFALSSSQFMELVVPNKNFLYVKDFLARPLQRKDLGVEIGSINYIGQSNYHFLRTKSLQMHTFLPEITSETALPIMPNVFRQMNLKKGDLVISKDSNIGEIVILDKDYPNYMLSGALYKLPVNDKKYYLLAFIKHNIFREQLDFMVPKGATIRHAKTIFLNCKIPMPNHNAENTIRFIKLLTQAIINKERLIKHRHETILQTIAEELLNNQKPNKFKFELPTIKDLEFHNRLDATFHSIKLKRLMFPILNYQKGFSPLTEQGLMLKPGPSLEIKNLEIRVDSEKYVNGFYRLITPKQILNYGVTYQEQFIGTPKRIPTIQHGDILFGESGTGRTMVYLDENANTINNAHAHILRPQKGKCSLEKAITIRCIMQHYKEIGIIDCLTVGGSGGHLSPSYFNRVYIPNFPEIKQKEIALLYHNPKSAYNSEAFTLDNFLKLDNAFNEKAGIYELDKSAKHLKEILNKAIDDIINDRKTDVRFCQ